MAANDVIAVLTSEAVYCTEFTCAFFPRNAADDAATRLLGTHTRRSLPSQGTTAFQSVFHVAAFSDDNDARLHRVAPEWVDVYCNNVKLPDVLAFVGPDDFLTFLDHTAATAAPSSTSGGARAPFTRRPSPSLLRCFPLRPGANALLCRVRRTGAAVEFTLWLYDPQARFIVMDIDGTVKMAVANFLPRNVLIIRSHIFCR